MHKIELIFNACTVEENNKLNVFELGYALQACGIYCKEEELVRTVGALNLKFPLSLSDFESVNESIGNNNRIKRGESTIPYASRGITLGQLKRLNEGLIQSGWLEEKCEQFNKTHTTEIENGQEFRKTTNLYAIDTFFVQPTTGSDKRSRGDIPEDIINTTNIPGVPLESCCFSQLINSDGLEVDYFVSHFWGHPFHKTVESLTNFAEGIYKDIGKNDPDDVVFWICLFALNQHKASEEVGSTPEQGPFNAALKHAKHGVVMVLDHLAEPMKRIWCLYEISRANEFGQPFQLIVEEGELSKASIETSERIGDNLLKLRAAKSNASVKSDKLKIFYRIMDHFAKNMVTSFEEFKENWIEVEELQEDDVAADELEEDNEGWFTEFDTHVCTLIGTPLLAAGLKSQSTKVCLQAIGMGAAVNVNDLKYLMESLELDVVEYTVETRFSEGQCALSHVFAYFGRAAELQYVIESGAELDKQDESGMTALHWAAKRGHLKICELLIERGADVDHVNEDGKTALHWAAWFGHLEICKLLIERGADVDHVDEDGSTALHCAEDTEQLEICKLLIERGADINHEDQDGKTPLFLAMENGHEAVVQILKEHGATS